jgi:hypothetical protein
MAWLNPKQRWRPGMAGIIFWFIFGLWLWGSFALAKSSTKRMPVGAWRSLATLLAAVLIFLLPLVDEIVGGVQFRALCERAEANKADGERIKGMTVRSFIDPLSQAVAGTAVKIYYSRVSYRDVNTNEEVASYTTYNANAGWLVRALGGKGVFGPLTIHPNTCSTGGSINKQFIEIK